MREPDNELDFGALAAKAERSSSLDQEEFISFNVDAGSFWLSPGRSEVAGKSGVRTGSEKDLVGLAGGEEGGLDCAAKYAA